MKNRITASLIIPIAAAILAVTPTTVLAENPVLATTGASAAAPAAPLAEDVLKSLKKTHPRLMVNAETPRKIKELIAQDAVAKSIYNEVSHYEEPHQDARALYAHPAGRSARIVRRQACIESPSIKTLNAG